MPSPLRSSLVSTLVSATALASLLASLLASGPAAASPSLWETATIDVDTGARKLRYDEAMHLGYELGATALSADLNHDGAEAVSPRVRLLATNRALRAFQEASLIDPNAAEPHYYAAVMLIYGKLECTSCAFDPQLAGAAIAELDAFEARAPLDPRLSVNALTKRAILHTRLAGATKGEAARGHLEAALADYRATLERNASTRTSSEVVYGNLAETLMMLGNVEEAIEQYRQALRVQPSTGVTLGLAVALDRDERGTEARALLRDLGSPAIVEWEMAVSSGDFFYVPEGEVYYYRGLINEALGLDQAAIENYTKFLDSHAHPMFAPRARANREALRTKRR
jgi:tetratricopeptide (TPR) repeat protein